MAGQRGATETTTHYRVSEGVGVTADRAGLDVEAGTWTRRRLLGGISTGVTLFAGCSDTSGFEREIEGRMGQPGEEAGDDRAEHYQDPETLVIAIPWNPEMMSFIWEFGDGPAGMPAVEGAGVPAEPVDRATNEPGLWGRWWSDVYWQEPGMTFPHLYEAVEIQPESVTIRLREDAVWSDGTSIRAMDAYAAFASWRKPRSLEDGGWTPAPADAHALDAVGEVHLPDGRDGRVVEFHLQDDQAWREIGGFSRGINRGELLYWLGGPEARMGVRFPSHVEPYRSIAAQAITEYEDRVPDPATITELAEEHVTDEDVDRLRKGDAYVSSGVWTLDEIVGGQRVLLEPNPHHRHVDRLAFETVSLEYIEHVDQLLSDLRAEVVDYAHLPPTGYAVPDIPDPYELVFAPAETGRSISFDHSTVFGDVRVRQAIAHAIDPERLAVEFPATAEPIQTPGGDTWRSQTVLDPEWADEALLSYDRDLERAAELMRAAGFERGNGDWWERDGRQVSVSLLSRWAEDSATVLLQTQLQDDFGLEVDLRFLDEGRYRAWRGISPTDPDVSVKQDPYTQSMEVFNRRWHGDDTSAVIDEPYSGRGRADFWEGARVDDRTAGLFVSLLEHWTDGLRTRAAVRGRNYFPHDIQEAGLQHYHENGRVQDRSGAWKEWTIDLPPIGDPTGDRAPFNPAYTAHLAQQRGSDPADPQPTNPYYNPPHDKRHPANRLYFWRLFAWAMNWWLPVLPYLRQREHHFVNASAWQWRREDGGTEAGEVREYFGESVTAPTMLSLRPGFASAASGTKTGNGG